MDFSKVSNEDSNKDGLLSVLENYSRDMRRSFVWFWRAQQGFTWALMLVNFL